MTNPTEKNCCCQSIPHAGTGRIGIDIRDLSVENDGIRILEHVNAVIPEGGCTAIVGPNGAGKTTLVLALLDEVPYTGSVLFRDGHRPRIGYVPQRLAFDRAMPLTVMEFLASFLQKRPICFGIRSSLREMIRSLLAETGCSHLEKRSLGALSGGELQRVLLCCALSMEPELLILDEPASGVDFKGGEVCCELLEKFRRAKGFTQLMVTHDISTVLAHATHVICLNRTVTEQGDPKKVLTEEVLARTFGLHHAPPAAGCSCHSCGEKEHHHDS